MGLCRFGEIFLSIRILGGLGVLPFFKALFKAGFGLIDGFADDFGGGDLDLLDSLFGRKFSGDSRDERRFDGGDRREFDLAGGEFRRPGDLLGGDLLLSGDLLEFCLPTGLLRLSGDLLSFFTGDLEFFLPRKTAGGLKSRFLEFLGGELF